jgi:outer membrane protein TolC
MPWGLNYNLGGTLADQTGTRPSVVLDPTNPVTVTNVFFDPAANANVTLLSTNFATINTRTPFEQTAGNVAAITLSQPLLKNFWIDTTRYQIYANKKNIKITQEDFRGQIMSTITFVENAYYDLASAEDFVTVQEKALQLAEQSLTENKKKVEVGALAPLDERQAAAQAASARADLLRARADLATAQRVLKSLLSDNYTNEWANVIVASKDMLLALPQQYNLQESWRRGIAQNPPLVAQRLSLDVAKYNVRLQRNQLFPEVNVIGTYGYNASGTEYSDAFRQIGNQNFPFWSVGGQLSVPLGRTSARNNLKSAKASQEQQALQLKQAEQQLLIFIENDIGNAQSDFDRVSATREATRYAEEALEAEQKKLENGKSTSFDVLGLQSKLTIARGNEISALAAYNKDLAKLAFDEGSTLERRKVMLNVDTLTTKIYTGNYPTGKK